VATTASESAIELLKRVPLFAELSPEELARVSQVAIPRRFPGDTRVFHEGDAGDACYIVQSGACRVTREHRDGRAITLANLGPGAIFGELAMFDGGLRSASVEAVEDTELLALPAADMRSLIREHPGMAEKLVVALTRRLRDANERISRQSFQTVPSRVAGVLRQLLTEDEVAADRQGGVTIRLRQSDLAQLAGTSRESVSRFLATLERAGVVRVGRARVTVVEPDRLSSYIF
jgi:CRP/FNR family transcriptional regulator